MTDLLDDLKNLPAIDIYKTIIDIEPGDYCLLEAGFRDELVAEIERLQSANEQLRMDELPPADDCGSPFDDPNDSDPLREHS